MKQTILAANARYAAQVDALLRELEPMSDERLNRRPADGGWSALQTLQHLVLVEENSLAYLRKKLSHQGELEKVSAGAYWRSTLLWLALVSPLKFKAPKASGVELIQEAALMADTRARWQKVRTAWLEFFEQMPDAILDKAVYKHPRAGRLSWLQMLRFFSTHFERHRAQIRRALAETKI